MSYFPHPIDTKEVTIDLELGDLCEALAKNAHENWAMQRMKEGWEHGTERDDATKKHPCLVPYEQLPESEKEYDRLMVRETIKCSIALGYRIDKV